jgi:flagellar hook assembly protein FlgD
MRTLTLAALSLTVAAFAVSANAADKYMSWEGTWHLNKKETVYPKGVHVTDNDLVVTKDDGDKLAYTETVVSDGKTDVQVYDGGYDGKYYDIKNGESMAFTHINADESRAVRHDSTGFVRENSIFELKNHGKKLICHAWAQQKPGGPEIAFDEIFDKAP